MVEPNKEMANYINNSYRVNPYFNIYGPRWRDHPNFSYMNKSPQFVVNPTPQEVGPPKFQGKMSGKTLIKLNL